jgi:hypothetical protein
MLLSGTNSPQSDVLTQFSVYQHCVNTSDCGLFVPESIIGLVVSVYQHCVSTSDCGLLVPKDY